MRCRSKRQWVSISPSGFDPLSRGILSQAGPEVQPLAHRRYPAHMVPLRLALLVSVFLAACSAPAPDGPLLISVGDWEAEIVERETGTGWVELPFTLRDDAGEPVTGLEVAADVSMPAHGHGSPDPVTAAMDADEPGRYVVSAFFSMPGEWEVLNILDAEGVNEVLVYTVEARLE